MTKSLQKACEPEGLIWAKSDLKVFVKSNTLWTGLGFTLHQLVLVLSSGVPGIYDVPENDNTNFSQRIKADINKK